MRIFRLITGLVALALVATMSTLATPTATAAAAQAAKPAHVVKKLDVGRVGSSNTFYVRGKAVTAPGKRVYVQVSNRKNGKYRPYKSDRATRTGVFRMTVKGAGNCFRVVVPATRRYRVYNTFIGCVRRVG